MSRIVKSGSGWRLGWDTSAETFQGLVGGADWAFELTQAEFRDFCRSLDRLATTIDRMKNELMDEEKITLVTESERLWLEAEGYPEAYSIHFILNTGRRCEGEWQPEAVPGLLHATRTIEFF
ncbi:MAG: DUF1818 family protein [Cyanobacteriota bacterium]|nr:DUF1818 family protein [Cyanobacteriota bacterium]